ncbi:hypothetical protein ACE14D_08960, partial [Streptomyces sp. Act-28]
LRSRPPPPARAAVPDPAPSTGTIDREPLSWRHGRAVEHGTAPHPGTAESEQVTRRFARGGPEHPTHRAAEEPGRAVRAPFA